MIKQEMNSALFMVRSLIAQTRENLNELEELLNDVQGAADRTLGPVEIPTGPEGRVEDNEQSKVFGMGFDLEPGETRGGSKVVDILSKACGRVCPHDKEGKG